MGNIQKFEEYINENVLSDTWDKIVEFFSSSVKNTIRKVKKTDSIKEKERLLNIEIEKQAKEYIKLAEEDYGFVVPGRIYPIVEVADDLLLLFELYKNITGKKHDRHVWRSEYIGGTFVWPELLKGKSEDEIVKHYNKKIEDLGNSAKREIKNLEKEREQFSNLLKSKDLNESFKVDSFGEFMGD